MDDKSLNELLKSSVYVSCDSNGREWCDANPAQGGITFANNLSKYTVTIRNDGGSLSVTDKSYNEALKQAVTWAIDSGWKPKQHWWQFWLERWPMGGAEEYKRQISVQIEQNENGTIDERKQKTD